MSKKANKVVEFIKRMSNNMDAFYESQPCAADIETFRAQFEDKVYAFTHNLKERDATRVIDKLIIGI